MLSLCGAPLSNYYNKVKLALLEKEIPFQEELVAPSQDESLLKRSPLGKIPFISVEGRNLSESQAILEYLEEAYPDNPLYPRDLFERAKCREFTQHLELNVELVARRIYREAFFGGTVSDETKTEVKERVEAGLAGLARLASFSPYVLGERFTAADVLAWVHFTLVSKATQAIYGENLVAKHIPGVAAYLETMGQRPHVQKVAADWDAALKAFLEKRG